MLADGVFSTSDGRGQSQRNLRHSRGQPQVAILAAESDGLLPWKYFGAAWII